MTRSGFDGPARRADGDGGPGNEPLSVPARFRAHHPPLAAASRRRPSKPSAWSSLVCFVSFVVRSKTPAPGDTCLKATPSSARRGRCTWRWPGRVVTRFETVLPALQRVHDDRPIVGRTVERGPRRRQAPADGVLRRPRPPHAHADERQLAHLPPGRALAARRAPRCGSSSATPTTSRSRSTCRSRSSWPHAISIATANSRALGPGPAGARFRRGRRRSPGCAPVPTSAIADALLDQRIAVGCRQRLQVRGAVRLRNRSVPAPSPRSATRRRGGWSRRAASCCRPT